MKEITKVAHSTTISKNPSELKSAITHTNNKLDLLFDAITRAKETFYPVCTKENETDKECDPTDFDENTSPVIEELYAIEMRIDHITHILSDLCNRSIV